MEQGAWSALWKVVDDSEGKAGGQGLVRKVVDSQGRLGALKVMHPADSDNSERRRRFAHEVLSLSTSAGKGVPLVIDSNTSNYLDKSVSLYFVQEWIDGEELSDIEAPIDLEDALAIVASLGAILERCHGRGVVHRDVKPNNVIRSSENQMYLIDLGIAWIEGDEHLSKSRTQLGQELGNRFLRLPELSASSKAKQDPRSDVSSLTGILFYLLTGQAPRILVDSEGRQPQERGKEVFTSATRADARFDVGIIGLFQANFSIEVSKRHASMRDFNRAISQLQNPGAVRLTRRMEQEAAYLALMNSAAQRQENSLNAAMKDACDAFIVELRSELSRLRPPLIESSIAGGARRSNSSFSNHVKVCSTSSGIEVVGAIVATTADGLVKGMARIADTGLYEFYSGPTGDLVGLRKAFVDQVSEFVGHALQEHVRLTEAKQGQ